MWRAPSDPSWLRAARFCLLSFGSSSAAHASQSWTNGISRRTCPATEQQIKSSSIPVPLTSTSTTNKNNNQLYMNWLSLYKGYVVAFHCDLHLDLIGWHFFLCLATPTRCQGKMMGKTLSHDGEFKVKTQSQALFVSLA